MIFVHSSFRTASTYIWSCLRNAPGTVAYCEIFHEGLDTFSRPDMVATGPDGWYSKHPPGAPYFLEFLPLAREGGGVQGFDPTMSYARFIPPEGCGGAISDAEAAYVAGLINHAENRGRIPVLTATRSLGRVRGLKAAFPGLHVLLYRNLFQQWCSFTDQACRGNSYFIQRMAEIVRLNQHDPALCALQEEFPVAIPSAEDANTFYSFVFLHLYLYAHAAGAADLVIDVNRLAADPTHRAEVERRIAAENVTVDLSGATDSVAYSVCRLGTRAGVVERLKVVGELLADSAPDEAGRAFGAKVLRELLEAYARHEFQAGALRSWLLGPDGPVARSDGLRAERDAALAARDATCLERDAARTERDAALAERDAVRQERDGAAAERAAALAARDATRQERDETAAERDAACAERDAALTARDAIRQEREEVAAERDAVRAERDAALTAGDAARQERDEAASERDAALTARDAALTARNAVRQECDQAAAERDAVRAECEAAVAERARIAADLASLQAWALADESAMLMSLSWRLTRPMRRLGFGRANRPARPVLRDS